MNSKIENLILRALKKVEFDKKVDNIGDMIKIERPNDSSHGHFATNIAMQLPKYLKMSPQKIAQHIVENMPPADDLFDKVEVKGPGFINFFLTDRALQSIIKEIKVEKERFGRNNKGDNKKTIVEFVSANPTGPLTVGHGRQAVLGDCIARILEWNGYDVNREYYYNDAGRQMRILGYSTYVRYRQLLGYEEEIPEDYYQGEYIKDVAQKIVEEFGDQYKDDKD
ncbi:MAG: arginine--tRNA ligase, partial [Candidatus Marinimicrobia bacterium]|nr:arginine--tRNA ligase [Candidatus Neomarinimicrobiota bacterium]